MNPTKTASQPARSAGRARPRPAARVLRATTRGTEASVARSSRRTSPTRRSGTIEGDRAAGVQVGTMRGAIRDRARGITVARLSPHTKHTPTLSGLFHTIKVAFNTFLDEIC